MSLIEAMQSAAEALAGLGSFLLHVGLMVVLLGGLIAVFLLALLSSIPTLAILPGLFLGLTVYYLIWGRKD